MADVNGAGMAPEPKRRSASLEWFLASRPDSFVAAATPVISSLALAWSDSGRFLAVPAICCFFFAVVGQAAANIVNDFSDYRTGANPELRAEKERGGRINRKSLGIAGAILFAVALLFGLATIPYGGTTIVYAGLALSAICVLYSVGPFPLSERGLGDVAVLTTFGVGSAVFTYFLQTKTFSWDALALGIVYGLAINNILVANNYADYEEDRSVNKHTTVVLFGLDFGRRLYLISGIAVVVILSALYTVRETWGVFAVLSLILYWAAVYRGYLTLCREDYEKTTGLAQAGQSVLLLGVLIPLTLLL